MTKQFVAASALVLAAAGTSYFAGSAQAGGDEHNAQGVSTSARTVNRAVTPIKCDGGASVNLRSRIVNSPFVFGETSTPDADRAVPGAQLALNGPASGTDTYLVTFTAESQVTGGDSSDWMGLELKLDGVNVNPYTASGDVLAFTGEPSWNANSIAFCTKVGPGSHLFQVFANLHDTGANSSLAGWLDDYTVSFQRFQ